jgi:hypothetical protein
LVLFAAAAAAAMAALNAGELLCLFPCLLHELVLQDEGIPEKVLEGRGVGLGITSLPSLLGPPRGPGVDTCSGNKWITVNKQSSVL